MEKDYTYIKANGIRKELQETNKLLKRIAKAIENKASNEAVNYTSSARWISDYTVCIDGVEQKGDVQSDQG